MDSTRDIGAASAKPGKAGEPGQRLGLVIGIGKYPQKALRLNYANADARAFYELMTDPECGRFTSENVQLLLDDQAGFLNIRKAFEKLLRSAGPEDSVWIYYAGHTVSEGKHGLYWLPVDGDVDEIKATGISYHDINQWQQKINARSVVSFLDSWPRRGRRGAEQPVP